MTEIKIVKLRLTQSSLSYRVGEIVEYHNHKYRVVRHIQSELLVLEKVEGSSS